MEGTNFLFEDTSTDLVKFLLDVDPWTSIDLKSIHNKFDSLDGEIINIFLEELLDNGILIDFIPDYEQIKLFRKKVGEYRINKEKSVDDNSEKETKKKLPFYQSDPESEYASFLEQDRIPSVVMFELTYNCNEMCVHCFNPGASRNFDEKSLRNKREEINLNHYRDLISDLNDLGVYKIILTGGDPFVKPKIWELIDLISNTNIVFDIYTNGLIAR